MIFSEWLSKKIEESGLSYSELARRGGTSHARISQVIGGETPGADFCVKIARALGESPEYVLRLAGILDPPVEEPVTEREMIHDLWQALQQQRKAQRSARATARERPLAYLIEEDKSSPDLEDIMEILRHLDRVELQEVYDFARWRYYEQEHRRDSNSERRRPAEARELSEFEQRIFEELNLISAKERETVLRNLIRLFGHLGSFVERGGSGQDR